MVNELERKTVHLLAGSALLFISIFISTQQPDLLRFFFLTITLCSLIMDFLIADLKQKIPLYKRLQRPHEKNSLHAHTYALLSILALLQFVDLSILAAAASTLIYGDAAAALVGTYIGKHTLHNKKTIEGSSAMLIVSLAVSFTILGITLPALGLALAATLAETLGKKVNDALTIPFAAALTGQLLLTLL